MSTPLGQSDAVAVEIASALNDANGASAFCLPLVAERLFARLLQPDALPGIEDPVSVQVFPGSDVSELAGRLDGIYDDTYECQIVLVQKAGAADQIAAQGEGILLLRSQIADYLSSHALSCPTAQRPFSGSHVLSCRSPRDMGVYDLARLEQNNVFYSGLIVTYRAVGLRRRTA